MKCLVSTLTKVITEQQNGVCRKCDAGFVTLNSKTKPNNIQNTTTHGSTKMKPDEETLEESPRGDAIISAGGAISATKLGKWEIFGSGSGSVGPWGPSYESFNISLKFPSRPTVAGFERKR